MMVAAGVLALAERAVEPLCGCDRRCLFIMFFKKGLSSPVPVGLAIRDLWSRNDEVE